MRTIKFGDLPTERKSSVVAAEVSDTESLDIKPMLHSSEDRTPEEDSVLRLRNSSTPIVRLHGISIFLYHCTNTVIQYSKFLGSLFATISNLAQACCSFPSMRHILASCPSWRAIHPVQDTRFQAYIVLFYKLDSWSITPDLLGDSTIYRSL